MSGVTQGIGLTPEQVRQVRARLSEYDSVRGFPGLDGLGLTQAQISTIETRVAAQVKAHTHPLGWPCKKFANRARTVTFVRQLLVGNGFRAYSITFYGASPNQIQFSAVQDGVRYAGAVARSGVREITIQISAAQPNPGETDVIATPFNA